MTSASSRRHASLLLALLLAAPLLAAPPAAAQAPDTVRIEQLTWTEVRDATRAGRTTVIIPVGGTEQSGPFIAVGKHNARAAVLSERIARQLGNALVAPVIAYVPEGNTSPPSSHMRFPGTISIPADAFERMVEGAAESFAAHGFTDVVLIGDHGGYQSNLRHVAETLNRRWNNGRARAHYISQYYGAIETSFAPALKARGLGADIGTHADLMDTALTLATAPDLVRSRELQSAPKPGTADGVYGGDPRPATAELGRLGTEAIVAQTVAAIRQATAKRP
ncbi:creatininase family protein [Roseomonas elaeocarpi]|uniref:Creatininase family protein n=1 Tax=Roseomonas elaeocarpi TaxID=907779 RepID=A0ABV6JRG6_9PROT